MHQHDKTKFTRRSCLRFWFGHVLPAVSGIMASVTAGWSQRAPVHQKPSPGNGLDELRRMVAAYKSLESLSVRTEGEIVFSAGKGIPVHQVTTIKYVKNPLRLALLLQDPNGTQQYVANGGSVVVYKGIPNTYTRSSVDSNIKAVARAINSESPLVLSPLIVLASDSLPLGVESAVVTGSEVLNGIKTTVVKGTFTDKYAKLLASWVFKQPYSAKRREFTLWLDSESRLIRQTSISLAWTGTAVVTGRTSRVIRANLGIRGTEKTTTMVVNSKLSPEDFRFVPPKGAVEIGH